MIISLAGHVDHGKTSLVRALTGRDTDQLAEEQRRGLTIDLGFAYVDVEDQTLGFVDVPGHHRFIHNMVAGIASNQYALLVVAADDGPMPQSREHLQILQLNGVSAGAVALTKIDLVEGQRRSAALEEIRALTADTFLKDAPIFETSTATEDGIPALRDHLAQVSAEAAIDVPPRQFRLAVDRAFNVKGAGLVVTGTIHAGSVRIDDELYVLPGRTRARVREIHRQNKRSNTAHVGDRCAINLTGVSLQQVRRGSWLGESPDEGSRQLVMRLRVLADFPRQVRHWTPVHVYHATSHSTGRLALLEQRSVAPGAEALVELVLDEPLVTRHDDPLVLRDQSLDRTLGGGAVVHNQPLAGRRSDPGRMRRIAALALPTPRSAFDALIELGPVHLDEFRSAWGLPDDEMTRLTEPESILIRGAFAVPAPLWTHWLESVEQEIGARHEADRALQGLRANELNSEVPAAFVPEVLGTLVSDGQLTHRAGRYAPARHQVSLTLEESSLFSRIEPHLRERQPPSVGDLAKRLGEAPASLRKRLVPLTTKGILIAVSDARFYLPEELAELVRIVEALAARGPFSVRDFRDAAKIGRNTAIEVLEYLDAKGYTRRNADTRSVVGDRARLLPQMVD